MIDLTPLERRITRLERLIRPPLWVDFTPTVTQSGAVTHTLNYARYFRYGKLAVVQIRATCTGAGTTNNRIQFTAIPSEIAPAQASTAASIGAGVILDSGTAYYGATMICEASTAFVFCGYNVGDYLGVAPNFALASGDILSCACAYEIEPGMSA